mgnify:CR=1 FL=1
MNRYIKVNLPLLLLLSVTLSGVYSCSRTESKPQTEEFVQDGIASNISPEKFQKLIVSNKGLIIDVRTPEEYQTGSIPGSENIDFKGEKFQADIDSLDRGTPVYLYCRSGRRSGITMTMMQEMGFTEIYNLNGGILAWSEEGLPVQK